MVPSSNAYRLLAGFFSATIRKNQVSRLLNEIHALSVGASIKHFAPYDLLSSRNTMRSSSLISAPASKPLQSSSVASSRLALG